MAFFEQHFTYFLGFGMPATVATYFFPYFINAGMFAFLFPLLIVAAVVADRETQLERIAASTHVVSLPAFYLPWKLNAFLLRLLRIKRKLNQTTRNTATVSGLAGNVSRPAKTVPLSKHQ
jgi:etoposide-induced 2.4 mRNA